MRRHRKLPLFQIHLLIFVLILLMVPMVVAAQDEEPSTPQQKVLQQRIDFGNAHIMGQSIKSGAVYLMHRKKSDIKNMIDVREDYRKEIIEDYNLEKTAIVERAPEQPENPHKD